VGGFVGGRRVLIAVGVIERTVNCAFAITNQDGKHPSRFHNQNYSKGDSFNRIIRRKYAVIVLVFHRK